MPPRHGAHHFWITDTYGGVTQGMQALYFAAEQH